MSNARKFNLQEELTFTLIKQVHEQLAPLSIEDRIFAVNMLLDYVTKVRDLDPMLDPAKVFEETLNASAFNPNDKINIFRA